MSGLDITMLAHGSISDGAFYLIIFFIFGPIFLAAGGLFLLVHGFRGAAFVMAVVSCVVSVGMLAWVLLGGRSWLDDGAIWWYSASFLLGAVVIAWICYLRRKQAAKTPPQAKDVPDERSC